MTVPPSSADVVHFCQALVQESVNEAVSSTMILPHSLEAPRWSISELLQRIDDPELVLGREGDIVHLNAFAQKNDPRGCGYYALRNALHMLAVSHAPDEQTATQLLQSIGKGAPHWKLYWHSRRLLKRHAAGMGSKLHYPWSTIGHGIMERPYMPVLLRELAIDYGLEDSVIVLPNLSVLALENGFLDMSEITTIQQTLSVFHNNEHNAARAFIVGTMTHWVCVFVSRINGKLDVVYLDSSNFPLLEKSDEEISKLNAEKFWDAVNRGLNPEGFGPLEDRLERSRQSLTDVQFVLRTFTQVAQGSVSFVEVCTQLLLQGFVNSYHKHVPSHDVSLLMRWLQHYFPPTLMWTQLVSPCSDLVATGHVRAVTLQPTFRVIRGLICTWAEICAPLCDADLMELIAASTGLLTAFGYHD